MRTSVTLAVLAWLSASEALVLHERQDGAPRVVSMDIERTKLSNPLQRDRLRRRGSVQATLDNEETLYFLNATIGTPAQGIRLHVDTGSSDLWVNTPSSKLCLLRSAPCQFAGTYAANSSSTYEYVGSYFNISYVDGSGASGDYVSDTVSIGGQKLDRLQFGVGYSSTSAQGILGIGYEINEVQVGRAGKPAYRNLPSQMVADGLIQSASYSLWLNDLGANRGSILFGGVDSGKYEGELQTLPIQSQSGIYAEFLITLTGLKLGTQAIANSTALAVLLDSGSSLTYLPDTMVQDIYSAVGAQFDADEGAAYVPCSLADDSRNLTFSFSEPAIAVEMNELVLDLITAGGKRPTFQNGATACLFGIAPAGTGTNVLGDTFLRSAYVVYDLENNEISLAQTRFNSSSSSVKEITAAEIPGATAVTNSVTATSGLVGARAVGISAVGSGMVVVVAFAAGLVLLMV
ncbi:acid protease [Coniochaeta ligniaria NRRL 30616]|uniref:Probable aspartic-type endopeptidase OPSB n=1 Tax=Coniochaeta ligniaria NRRL 30616 TaxID=1408157 RepID=A0A1J7J062_9PEZI|nr:acid protease [Coniochaeta ligniaria NRRL 30616]